MSEFKGTPGPWTYCGCTRGGCVCGLVFGGEHAVATTTLDHDEELSSHQPGEAAKRANARLIAAAPELLEACHTALAFVAGWAGVYQHDHGLPDFHPKHKEAIEQVKAAIAKATGGDA